MFYRCTIQFSAVKKTTSLLFCGADGARDSFCGKTSLLCGNLPHQW
jgi:hypothetical protein